MVWGGGGREAWEDGGGQRILLGRFNRWWASFDQRARRLADVHMFGVRKMCNSVGKVRINFLDDQIESAPLLPSPHKLLKGRWREFKTREKQREKASREFLNMQNH